MRRFQDARVRSVPSESAQAEIVARYPGTHIKILCQPGERLSAHDQDVGSYRYGIVSLAAASREARYAAYADVAARLRAEFVT